MGSNPHTSRHVGTVISIRGNAMRPGKTLLLDKGGSMKKNRIHSGYLLGFLAVLVLTLGGLPLHSGAFSEAPMLAELVKTGDLPRVDKRLPPVPVLVSPVETVGLYGGVWRRAYVGTFDTAGINRVLYDPLVRWTPEFTIGPNIAERWEITENGRVFTFYLVKGLRWSDGEPFTSEDILFYFEDVVFNDKITPSVPRWLRPAGKPPQVTKVDDYTIRFEFDVPYSLFLEQLATPHGMELVTKPKHYLKQFHEKYADPDSLKKLARDRNADNWLTLFKKVAGTARSALMSPEIPSICAWIAKARTTEGQFICERNPYYWKVDDDGNQLPYIDRIVHERLPNSQAILRKALEGQIDMQGRRLGGMRASKLLLENLKDKRYRLVPKASTASVAVLMAPNLNHKDPVLRKVLSDRRFRIALSHAVHRPAINKIVFRGLGKPRQAAPLKGSRFYRPSYEKIYTRFDPAKAMALMDEMGLRIGPNGKRLRPDGKPLEIELAVAVNVQSWVDAAEIVSSNLRDVGIQAMVKTETLGALRSKVKAAEHDIALWSGDGGMHCLLDPRWYFPYSWESFNAPRYGQWFQGNIGSEEEPPDNIKALMNIYRTILQTSSKDAQQRLFEGILEANEHNLWVIGLVHGPPDYYVVGTDFHNVPSHDYSSWMYPNPGPIHPEQFYMTR
jgi:peptide/nickel transport system substrate-binding protein